MSLKTQIIGIFLFIMIITIGASSFIFYNTAKENLLERIFNNLEAVSESKKQRMLDLLAKRKEQIKLIQIREVFSEDLAMYLENGDEQILNKIRNELIETRELLPSYKDIYLISTEGKIIVASDKVFEGSDFIDGVGFAHAMNGEICLHDLFYDDDKELSHHVTGALTHGGEIVGVIVIKTEAGSIYDVIHDYTGLGKTGETSIAQKTPSGDAYFIAATRFLPLTEDSIILPSKPKYAISHALIGREGILSGGYYDYRDKIVIASSRYIDETGWGMITKIDEDEALAPINKIFEQTVLIALLLVLLVGILAYYFTRRFVNPILELGKISNQIAQGQLDKRITYKNKDEIGILANNYNLMADKLVASNKSLLRKVDEMNRINESLNRFAYVVSHDLKSPLNSITALLELLRKKLNHSNQDVLQMVEMAEMKTSHMQDLIHGILKFSLSSTTDGERENINLNLLVNDIVGHLEVPRHIDINIGSMPNIYIERILILQVFQNLISNAIKYMDKQEGRITIGSKNREEYYEFFVTDNGRGIDKSQFDKIFDIFNKTNMAKDIDSTGLGLSIVKRIIENKGGRIWVESEVGIGSTFYFILPNS